jgi:Hypoxia induced protein conserved region
MPDIFFHLTTIAAIAVFIVLVFGLRTMMTGESPNLSQKLMRWRVGLQFVAIIVIMVAVYLRR